MSKNVAMPTLYKTYSERASVFCNLYTARIAIPVVMTEPSDRLRQARLRKGYAQAIDASTAYGWNKNTYASNENGNAPFSFKSAQKYAAAYGVRAEWLYTGSGPMVDDTAPANDDVLPSDEDFQEMVTAALLEVPPGTPLAGYPAIVASSLRDRLALYRAHGGFRDNLDVENVPDKASRPPAATTGRARAALRNP